MVRISAAHRSPSSPRAGPRAIGPGRLRPLVVFAGFLALTFWVRRITCLFSVLDWDESLYLLVARGILSGHLPYTEVYDNKPPGIYFLFALGQLAFGHSVMALRILTCVAVAATCTGLEALGRLLSPGRPWAGALAGFLYTVYAIAVDRASNTELFFAPFSVAAILVLFSGLRPGGRVGGRGLLVSGLLAGVAMQIKPFVLVELVGIGLWRARKAWAESRSLETLRSPATWRNAATFAGGLVFPGLVIVGMFALSGRIPEYLDANVRANKVLGGLLHIHPTEVLTNTARHAQLFWPLWFGALVGAVAWAAAQRSDRKGSVGMAPVLVWFMFSMVAVGVVGGRFRHYYLEPLVPLSLIAASGAAAVAQRAARRAAALGLVLVLAFAGAILWRENEPLQRRYRAIVAAREASGNPEAGDLAAVTARRIRAAAAPDDRIYVVDYEPILYFLLDRPVPTRYAFPPFLANPRLNRVANVDAVSELGSILSGAPRFLVRSAPLGNAAFYRVLDPLVERFYEEVDASNPPLRIYRLREGAADSLRRAASRAPRER